MRKTQLLLDQPAECEQLGLLPRGSDDLHADRLLIRTSGVGNVRTGKPTSGTIKVTVR